MTKAQFFKSDNVRKIMLRALGVLEFDKCYLPINLSPEYEITPYRREYGAYYFRNSWNFADRYEYIIDLEIESYRIFTEIDIDEMSKDLRISKQRDYGDHSCFLQLVRKLHPDAHTSYGFPTDIDQFDLQQLRILNIDNTTKSLYYEGSYQADAGEVEMDFFPLYAYLDIEAVPLVMENFYQNLLAESYILFLQRNDKLAFFILYSALENFLQQAAPNIKGQVDQRLLKLFTARFRTHESCEIYTALKQIVQWGDKFRNDIAHGKKHVIIDRKELEAFMDGVLALLCAYEQSLKTFHSLQSWLEHIVW